MAKRKTTTKTTKRKVGKARAKKSTVANDGALGDERTSAATSAAGSVGSMRGLAKELGVSPKTVSKWAGDARWPFGKRGPYDVEAVRRWRSEVLAPNPADLHKGASGDADPDRAAMAVDLDRAKTMATIAKTRADTKKKELEYAILHGKYVLKTDAEVMLAQRASAFRVALAQLSGLVLEADSLEEASAMVRGAVEGMLSEYERESELLTL